MLSPLVLHKFSDYICLLTSQNNRLINECEKYLYLVLTSIELVFSAKYWANFRALEYIINLIPMIDSPMSILKVFKIIFTP